MVTEAPPRPTHLLETALYVDDMERAVAFYREVVGLELLESWERGSVLAAGPAQVLLLFRRGATADGAETPAGRIPPHDGAGPVHVAFAITAETLPAWEAHLEARGVAVESRIDWRRGGTSLYFRDPDGHSVEIATPGVWPVY